VIGTGKQGHQGGDNQQAARVKKWMIHVKP